MIRGAHIVFFSSDAEADRAFLRDVLGFRYVDDGGGWLIFALPPSEAAVHPRRGDPPPISVGHDMLAAELYLMCDDLPAVIQSLEAKGVRCTEVSKQPWGTCTTIPVPSGGKIGLYQPKHQTPLGIGSMQNFGAVE